MSIISAILIISVSLNVLFFYLSRSWKHEFVTKLTENEFYESEDVHVRVERKFNRLELLVSSKQLNFQVIHDLKEESEEDSKEVVDDHPNDNSK